MPALRQSARLLAVLAEHDTVIRDLVTDADTVIGKLADNRRNVGRFVEEARDTSAASAQRADDIRLNFNRLPHFLEELTPTMVALGEVAEEQRPVLVDLGDERLRAAPLLRRHRRLRHRIAAGDSARSARRRRSGAPR